MNITEEGLKAIIQEGLKKSKLENIGQIGNSNLYYLGQGCYTNEKGWEDFKKRI